MKGQKIFHSFLPGVTVAVLSTQPVFAHTIKITGIKLIASPSVLSSNHDDAGTPINTNQQSATTAVGNTVTAPVTSSGGSTTAILKSGNNGNARIILTGKTGVPVKQAVGKVQSVLLSFKPTSKQTDLVAKIRSASSHQRQSNPIINAEQKPKEKTTVTSVVTSDSNSKPTSSVPEKSIPPSQQPTIEKKNSDSQIPRHRETTQSGTVVKLSQMLEQLKICPQQDSEGKMAHSASLLLKSFSCLQENTAPNQVAQAGSTSSTPNAPVNVTQNGSSTQSTPATPIPSGSVPVPEYLNPSPNPLQFPTRPEDVRVRGTQPITLPQALELARRNNRDLQQALLTLERNRFLVREAQAALLPSATVNSDVTRSGPGFADRPEQTEFQRQLNISNNQSSSTSFNAGAQIQYDLYTSGRRQSSIRAAEEQLRSAELEVELQSELIRLNVTTQYYDLQQADENVRIAQSAVTNAQASLRDAQALERAGVSTRFDVLRSQVNLANAQQQLTNSLSQQRIARRQLAQTLSLAQAVDISAAEPVRLAGLWNLPLDQTIVIAFQNRPELQQRLTDRNVAEQRRRQALSDLGPQLSLVASYNAQDEFDDGQSIQDNYSVGVRASLNLFDGGAARARANQERVNIRIAENQFASQRDQIRFEVEQAYSDLQANLENVQTATTAVDQSREALRLARLRFQAGVGTQTEVIDAENDLTRSEGQRIQAILEYNRALARLQRAITARAPR
ncbi:hypothetical protein NUACC21_41870 [Scytonema sp. NUACC21]